MKRSGIPLFLREHRFLSFIQDSLNLRFTDELRKDFVR